MGKHNVYLRKEHEAQLRREAERVGLPLQTLLGKRIADATERASKEVEIGLISTRISRIEDALERVFSLFEILAMDLAYVAGVTRTSTQSNVNLAQAGRTQEVAVKAAVEAIRDPLKKASN